MTWGHISQKALLNKEMCLIHGARNNDRKRVKTGWYELCLRRSSRLKATSADCGKCTRRDSELLDDSSPLPSLTTQVKSRLTDWNSPNPRNP
jgi:hypothetical protein